MPAEECVDDSGKAGDAFGVDAFGRVPSVAVLVGVLGEFGVNVFCGSEFFLGEECGNADEACFCGGVFGFGRAVEPDECLHKLGCVGNDGLCVVEVECGKAGLYGGFADRDAVAFGEVCFLCEVGKERCAFGVCVAGCALDD